jgi:hypothetical protein
VICGGGTSGVGADAGMQLVMHTARTNNTVTTTSGLLIKPLSPLGYFFKLSQSGGLNYILSPVVVNAENENETQINTRPYRIDFRVYYRWD